MAQSADMVQVDGQCFIRNGKPYYFIGTNFWYGLYLAMPGDEVGRNRLQAELDQLQELGVNNLRVMLGFEGPEDAPWRVQPPFQPTPGELDERFWQALDYFLEELHQRDMTAVMCLSNYYYWSGGLAQYYSWATNTPIPYPNEGKTWTKYLKYAAKFFGQPEAEQMYRDFIEKVITRVNALNGRAYKDEPAIFAWQLANEPRGFFNINPYLNWVKETAAFIKSLDPNHLVSLGSEGLTPSVFLGTAYKKVSQDPNLDYLTAHVWVENWGWYHPEKGEKAVQKATKKALKYIRKHFKIANRLNQPLVLEEFGIARDYRQFEDTSATAFRDFYYQKVFDLVYRQAKKRKALVGANFWAWGGQGRPQTPGGDWQPGWDVLGDPPHEPQGWYSVYDTDESTLQVIREYAKKMIDLANPDEHRE